MIETLFKRVAPEDMNEGARAAYDALKGLTGDATFVEVVAQAAARPDLRELHHVHLHGGQLVGE